MGKKYRRRIFFGIVILVILISIIIGLYVKSRHNYENGILSAGEKRWVEKNKNQLIDISLLNNVPLFGSAGSGVFFNFLNDFTEKTGLTFNKIAYNYGADNNTQYAFKILKYNDSIKNNDVVFYEDNYVIVSKSNKEIYSVSELSKANIGVLSSDLSDIAYYLGVNSNISYTQFNSIDEIISSMETGNINYFIVPEVLYLDKILSNNYYIVYTILEMKDKYVLSLNGNKTLNAVFQKFLNVWLDDNNRNYYNNEYLSLYYNTKSISEGEKYNFDGKVYKYGYISNMPYEEEYNNVFAGLNKNIFDSFMDFADVEIEFIKYDTKEELIDDFNKGKIDIIFNYEDNSKIKKDYILTASPYNLSMIILKKYNDIRVIDSVASLNDKKVHVMNNTLSSYLEENSKATLKLEENINKLFSKSNELIIVDKNTYRFYANTKFKNYIVAYEENINANYNYLIRNTDDNRLFGSLLSYYLLKNNKNYYENISMIDTMERFKTINYNFIYYTVGSAIIVFIIVLIVKNNRKKYNKEDKVKYIDHLTSLKNRNYLNDNYGKWEANAIYPQTVIIINMNNLSHINDVYGHEEGDNLIKLAANKLINNQLSQSDIIRTDGNEFLIYMVGYDENKVITYIKKLYKELKEVSHGFGATIGYSMIEDDIKTIDDAINEAILDIKTNKELPEK